MHSFIIQIFGVDQPIAGSLHRRDQLVQLQMNGAGVAVLGLLDQENHQERDDRRSRIDGELPRVGIAANGPHDQPDHNDREGCLECPLTAGPDGDCLRRQGKAIGFRQGLLDLGLMPFGVLRHFARTQTS